MAHVEFEIERSEHPLDMLERLASLNDWTFDRAEDDEMSISIAGSWAEYHVAFTWIEEVEAVHIACAFDIKVPERRQGDMLKLVALINEQLWVGHFDLWSAENVVMYRHALLLAGGAEPTRGQCEMLLKTATDACERYYQAFQFVLWAGKSAREALDSVLFETEGEA
ncbi:YbjN domain-containing protein [Chelatococcus sp. SYSU_G07232]|uniref:YbjN domain-containing protein n=1 Tax=Chelatococcus albus TaxID=3047466 RepID=A0ABT7AIT2_9HYPH|nr:YbjN domain-containing protein [Chelatococcus sp. SYSU_G07232]MDJ1159287.1 YbjN domain-containing protein [Chelatococcus sp. SYSU_G07232]